MAVHAAVAAASAASTQWLPASSRALSERSALQCAAGAHANARATAISVSTTVATSRLARGPVAALASARSRASAESKAPSTSRVAFSQSSRAFFSFRGLLPLFAGEPKDEEVDLGSRSDASSPASAPRRAAAPSGEYSAAQSAYVSVGLSATAEPVRSTHASSRARTHDVASARVASLRDDAMVRSRSADADSRNACGVAPGGAAGTGGKQNAFSSSLEEISATSGASKKEDSLPSFSFASGSYVAVRSRSARRSHSVARRNAESARHASSLCSARIAASSTPREPSKKVTAGESFFAARAARASSRARVSRSERDSLPPRPNIAPTAPPPPRRRATPPPCFAQKASSSFCASAITRPPRRRSSRTTRVTAALLCPSATIDDASARCAFDSRFDSSPASSEDASSAWNANASSASHSRRRNDTSRGGRAARRVGAAESARARTNGFAETNVDAIVVFSRRKNGSFEASPSSIPGSRASHVHSAR